MSQNPSQPLSRHQIFISYSHRDAQWIAELKTQLKPLIRNYSLQLWHDNQILPETQWHQEIEQILAASKVALLLISPNFLASDLINDELLPRLDAAAKAGLTILWIPISYSLYEETPVRKYQAAHSLDQPLDRLNPSEQNRAWVNIGKKIKSVLVEQTQPPKPNPKIYRFTLPSGATDYHRKHFHAHIKQIEQANPNWKLQQDKPQPGEEEALLLIYQDEDGLRAEASYILYRTITEIATEAFQL